MQEEKTRLESELPPTIAAARILTPNLVILLGSTSALAGLELMRHMLTLRPADQKRVALVYIDTDDPPAPLVEFRRQHSNVFLEFPLRIAVPTGISNATRSAASDQHTFIEQKVPQYFANGAGGIRNNGHVAACFNYQYIYDVLDRALMAVARLNTEQSVAKTVGVQANIVAFLGGGTGSGILNDIAVIVRDLLTYRQYKQRINLFCMLPEPINGASLNDLRWRKSNATACLLEMLAYSRVAATEPGGEYQKYMRNRLHRLTNDPIANEVYLIGHTFMDDGGETARIVGLDLFQRSTNASGVGFLEHSRWMDRRTLGTTDERGLPTMFGTSCPLEVRFPASETATAFAHISTAHLLPLLAGYQPTASRAGENEKREWNKEWTGVARFEANESNPYAVKLGAFRSSDFEDAAQPQLDLLWTRLERFERNTEARIQEIIDLKGREEQKNLDNTPVAEDEAGNSSLLNRRIRHLRSLQQEYQFVLERLRDMEAPRVPLRPYELEEKLLHQSQLPGVVRKVTRDYASATAEAYNDHLRRHAHSTRYRLLEQLVKNLNYRVQEAIAQSLSWLQSAGAEEHARELQNKALGSMAWRGKLEYPHPHQRHIFDLPSLRTENEHNVAIERLYRWATTGKANQEAEQELDYQSFVGPCAEFLARNASTTTWDNTLAIDQQSASRLTERIVDFFHHYYMTRFADTNLFELLDRAAPPAYSGQPRNMQISHYILEHLEHMHGLMSSLVAFEAELWPEGLSALDTSLYLGIAWRDGSQEAMLKDALDNFSALTSHGQTPIANAMYDPHRLQVSYGQHAISLSTVRDFYLEHNSAMEYYLEYQQAWEASHGTGLMPVHNSGEAERLVQEKDALGLHAPLPELVIRHSSVVRTPNLGVQFHGRPQGSPLP